MIMKRGVLGGTYRGQNGGGRVWIWNVSGLPPWGGGVTYVLLPSASELIPRCQSCSAPKLVCKGKCLKAAACPVVEPRVPDWTLAEPGYNAIK